MPRSLHKCSLLYVSLLAAAAAFAGDKNKPAEAKPVEVEEVDVDFLEFLGAWDSDDEGWNEYLATTDVSSKEKAAAKKAAKKAAESKAQKTAEQSTTPPATPAATTR